MRRTQLFCYILALACLLQFTLPFHAVYAAPQYEAQASESALFGEKFLLCTSEGFKWVSWAELEESEHKPAEHQDYECGLCVAASMFGKTIAASGNLDSAPTFTHTLFYVFADDTLLISKQASGSNYSRGPPINSCKDTRHPVA